MKDNHLVDMNIHQTVRLSLVGAIMLALASCGSDNRTPGRTFVPDMAYSQAYETYTKNPSFGQDSLGAIDSFEARLPVAHTIARGLLPATDAADEKVMASFMYKAHYANTDSNYLAAGNNLKNPFQPEKDVLDRGKYLYTIHCMVCHGEKGLGDGSIVQTEAYPPVPSYADRLPTISEGQMFHSITYGKNLMGSYSYALTTEDRWKVIYYIQQLVNVGPFAKGAATTTVAAPADTTTTAN
jgi:cytochrome c